MRKIALFFSISCMIVSLMTSAFAESALSNTSDSFPLHGDVRFGMGIEEVSVIEKEQGFTCDDSTDETDNLVLYSPDKVLVAGLTPVTIDYNFDDTGKLFLMKYHFYDTVDSDINNKMTKQLTEKYGKPVASCKWNFVLRSMTGTPVNIPEYFQGAIIDEWAWQGGSHEVSNFEEWLLEKDDGYIFIQHLYSGWSATLIGDIYVTYAYFDKDTFDSFTSKSDSEADDL